MNRKITLASILFFMMIALLPFTASGENEKVYVIPINKEVEKGLTVFLERAITTAEESGAETIIFDMNTPGGLVESASDIGNLIAQTNIKTVTFINSWALSAGSYIALHTEEIYMTPNATMGASAVIDSAGNTAGEKAESMWLAAMEGAAEQHNRDPQIARAMVNGNVELPKLKEEGKLLTLNAKQALEVGYSNGTVQDIDKLLATLGYEHAEVVKVEPSFAEKLARFVTNPVVIPILLSIASLGLVLELYSPGIGLPGIAGLTALLLYFYGHFIAGLAGYETVILFVIGLILIAAEFFLPGGIAGTLGAGAIIGSVIMAGGNVIQTTISVFIAIVLAVVAIVVLITIFGKRFHFFRKFVLTESTNTESGYVSNVNRLDLLGLEGITYTQLRPAGTVIIGEERLDVVAEGRFIEKDMKVKVIQVEGSRIVVREVQ